MAPATPDLEAQVLAALQSTPKFDTYAQAKALGVDHQALVGAVKSLWADGYVSMDQKSATWLNATKEGCDISKNGSPEYKVYAAVSAAGSLPVSDLEKSVGKASAKVGLGAAMREKWLKKGGDGSLSVAKEGVVDTTRKLLEPFVGLNEPPATPPVLQANDEKQLLRRKLLKKETLKQFEVAKGANYSLERKRKQGDLSVDMLRDGSWKTADFKAYNYNAVGAPVGGGYFQPLLKVRAEFRKILMGMGFEEMPTSKWVESSFWNFDALFQPQSHPARDAHDTFFVKEPAATLKWPADYYERVKTMHVSGGSGSIGHRCPFDENEARKQILRTHTTAVSARMLYQLANREGGFKPAKYFSIDRVFRNETMVLHAASHFVSARVDGVLWPRRRRRDTQDATPHNAGLDAPLRVPPGRGLGRRLRFEPGQPQVHHPDLLRRDRHHAAPVQARVQPVHRAVDGGLRLPPRLKKVDGDRELGHLPAGDARAHGPAAERSGDRVGPVARAADDDQVPHRQH